MHSVGNGECLEMDLKMEMEVITRGVMGLTMTTMLHFLGSLG